MKYLFLVIFVLLVLASVAMHISAPVAQSDVPVLYWVTDGNPAREQQIELFNQWMIRHGYTASDGRPAFELRMDVINRDPSKMIIQGLSGMGGDILDLGPADVPYFQAMGLLHDITDDAVRLGFDTSHTYKAIENDICINGRQYAFPCNVYVNMYWVNNGTFRRFGLSPPPKRWTLDEFEAVGRAFVERANTPGKPRIAFFANAIDLKLMMRSSGLSIFNETLTRSMLDDPIAVDCISRLNRWINEYHLIPTRAEYESFAATSSYGGQAMYLFYTGRYAMISYGRYALIRLREYPEIDLSVVEPPHAIFPIAVTGSRPAGIYQGSRYKDLAVRFLQFLTDEQYNLQIVRDADALPPNPSYTRHQEFLRPVGYPNEWDCHQAFAQAAESIAVSVPHSPFILGSVVDRYFYRAQDLVLNQLDDAEHAFREAARLINKTIDRNLREDPGLKQHYDRLVGQQQQIDALLAAGRKVPIELIENPFYKRYYAFLGLLE